jgi:hypothetical protein
MPIPLQCMRKKRNDRNYVLYRLYVDGSEYIGLTVSVGRAFLRSVKVRVQKHMSRANVENKDWTLCNALRNADVIEYEVLEVIRGRKAAYSRERELIAEYQPELNDF